MIKLGERYKDKITGFEGIATARSEFLNGCKRTLLEATISKEGKLTEEWFDDQRLTDDSEAKTGGPGPTPPPLPTP